MFQRISHLHIWFFDAILPVLAGDRCQSATVISGHPVLSHSFPCFLRTVMSGATFPSWCGGRRNASGNVGPEINQPLFALPAPPPKKITTFLEMLEGLESSLGVYGATASTNEFRQFKSRPGRPGEQLGKIAWRKWNWPARKHAIYATISSSAVSSLCSTNGCIAGGANLQLEGSNNCLWKFYHASFINFLAGPGGPLVRCPRKDHLWNAWVVWEVVVGQVGYVVCRQGAAVDGGGGCG